MSIQAAKEELASLTEFQKDIHVTNNINEDIISTFYKVFTKSTWYSSVSIRLECSPDSQDLIYKVNNSFHFLVYSYMCFQTPPVRINEAYLGKARVAWCHNLATNRIQQAEFWEDDQVFQTWDNVWADIYFQFYQSPGAGKRENHDAGIGNVRCLEQFSEFLPSYPLNCDQPWFYSMDPALAFPIFYKNSLTRAEHRYRLRNKITDLLRIQVFKNGEWRSVKQNFSRYVDIKTTDNLPPPEIWGRYAYISEPEINWHKKCNETQNRVFYTRDIIKCDTPNPTQYNQLAVVELKCPKPCLAMFWVAENQAAISIHNRSNYTTDPEDLYAGWDPVKWTSLDYNNVNRFHKMPSHHFTIAEPRKHFPSAPCERGYHGHSFANDSTSFHGDIGIVFDKLVSRLTCQIANTDIYKTSLAEKDDKDNDIEEEEDILLEDHEAAASVDKKSSNTISENNQNIILRTRLLVARKFTITQVASNVYNFKID